MQIIVDESKVLVSAQKYRLPQKTADGASISKKPFQ
jgi:hypothetical protein